MIAVNVVKKIVASIGEEIEVKYYDRLLPLVTLKQSLGKREMELQQTLKIVEYLFLVGHDI